MKRAVIGVLVGAAVYFAWSAVSWTVLTWHDAAMKRLPNERLLVDTLKTVVKEPGLYCFPKPDPAASDQARSADDPVGLLAYRLAAPPSMTPQLVFSFLGDVAMASLLMWIFWVSRLRRVVHLAHVAAAVGLIAGLAGSLPSALFMNFPAGYTVVSFLDLLIGFVLAGLAMARFVPDAGSPERRA